MTTRRARPLAALLVVSLLVGLSLFAPAQAADVQRDVQVFVNGRPLDFDVPPQIVSGRTLVPLRVIFEALGATVDWDGGTRTASARWPAGELSIAVGAEQAKVNGGERRLDVPAQIIGGRTLVPLRFVAEALGAQVGWYGQGRAITIHVAPRPLLRGSVSRVIDGDTVEVVLPNNRTEKVRLIGVDTPETVHPTKGEQPYGREASNFSKARLGEQTVMLELDAQERDRYGRLLAYVYLENGTMFNAVLMDEGYAQAATFPPNVRYVEVFRALQSSAREAGRGLWAASPASPAPGAAAPPSSGGSFPPDANGECAGQIKGNASSSGEKIYHLPSGAFYARTRAEECFSSEAAAESAGYRRSSR